MNQLTIEWTPAKEHSIPVTGYRVLLNGKSDFTINGKPASEPLPPDHNQTVIDKLQPGKTTKVRFSLFICAKVY